MWLCFACDTCVPLSSAILVLRLLTFQIDSMVDVGKPLYGQMQKVKGSENDNVNVTAEPPPPVSVYDMHSIKNRKNMHSLGIIVKQLVLKA